MKYPKSHTKHDFPGIVNLELDWNITEIVFKMNFIETLA